MAMYTGLLLKEGLEDLSVLDDLNVTKTEAWAMASNPAIQPQQWAAIHFEVNETVVDDTAQQLSRALKQKGWYVTMHGEKDIVVVFPGKVFRYVKGDAEARSQAIEYGLSVEIPESELDWNE